MHVLIIYDIKNDRLRTKISNTLKDWGLERIQYSVFIGDLTSDQRRIKSHDRGDYSCRELTLQRIMNS